MMMRSYIIGHTCPYMCLTQTMVKGHVERQYNHSWQTPSMLFILAIFVGDHANLELDVSLILQWAQGKSSHVEME